MNDEALREKILDTLLDCYHSGYGFDYNGATDKVLHLIAEDRERVEREARLDENQSIESMLEEVIADKRDCCYNHEKYSAPCHACKLVRWRKVIAKEYLRSIRERIAALTNKPKQKDV